MSKLDASQIAKIIEIYKVTNSIQKTREITGHASMTISNYIGSISRKKTNSRNCKNEINQIDVETGKIINTWFKPSVAAKELNINPSCICRALKGDLKKAGGFRWEYKNSEES